MLVYLVEDDANIRELVLYTLKAGGFDAEGFEDAPGFYKALRAATPDLALLDLMLPGEDGLAILKALRAGPATKKLPVMLLTAKDTEFDKVLGLDLGADDYLAKPFGMMELLARVRALLRRAKGETPEEPQEARPLVFGPLELDAVRHRVSAEGAPVELTMKEFELLRLLMENPGRVFDRDRIMERVWDYEYEGETRTVDVHVRSLRSKLGAAGALIETVRGIGYRMKETP